MYRLTKTIDIQAPKETVWHAMLDLETYGEWTAAFCPGSTYEGSWEKGSKILFVGPDGQGGKAGMVSEIAENRPYEYVSIQHRGVLKDGVEDTTSPEVLAWGDAQENYTFTEKDGVTTVKVELDTEEKYREMFEETWPKALQKLKEIAER